MVYSSEKKLKMYTTSIWSHSNQNVSNKNEYEINVRESKHCFVTVTLPRGGTFSD